MISVDSRRIARANNMAWEAPVSCRSILPEDGGGETGVLLARYLFTGGSPEERRRVGAAMRKLEPEAAQRFLKVVGSADPDYLHNTVLDSEESAENASAPLSLGLGAATAAVGGLDQRWLLAGAVALALLLLGCCAMVLCGSSRAAAKDGKK
ncbi:unnamed protein product, partial [Prorocentrum cordatum]